jgi:hypothetical protein
LQCRRRLPIYARSGDFVRELLTVKQLIEVLKKFPLDAKVFYEMRPNGAGTIGFTTSLTRPMAKAMSGLPMASGVTSKAANSGHFKTGQRKWP